MSLITWCGVLCVVQAKLKFPSTGEEFTRCFIATDSKASDSPAGQQPRALFGQLGPVYMFKDALTQQHVTIIHLLGPSYMYTFSNDCISVPCAYPASAAQGKGQGKGQSRKDALAAQKTKASLGARIFLAYNAKARDGSLFLDNTPRSNRGGALMRKAARHAISLPGTHQCVTRHVKDVMTCLGGIQVLFPLIAQLDQPTRKPGDAPGGSGKPSQTRGKAGGGAGSGAGAGECRREDLDYTCDQSFFVSILRVFCVMVRDSKANQLWMAQTQGFAILGLQLEKASPLHFSEAALQAIRLLLDTVVSAPPLFASPPLSFTCFVLFFPS